MLTKINHLHQNLTLFVGPGLKSRQQKALKLLEIMDPSIRQHLGTKQIATGDYTWKDDMRSGLQCAIASRLDKWVTETVHPPYSYDKPRAPPVLGDVD